MMTLNLFEAVLYHTTLLINKTMYRYLFIALLVTLACAGHDSDYFVSPPIPPTAFVG